MKCQTIRCVECGIDFQKPLQEITRKNKMGNSKFYCSRACTGISKKKDDVHFTNVFGNSKKAARVKGFEFELTLDYLKEIFEKQNGRCAYTNVELSKYDKHTPSKLTTMSLDRIDSSKGYVTGNVEFVCMFVNLGKRHFSKEAVQDFLKQILLGS